MHLRNKERRNIAELRTADLVITLAIDAARQIAGFAMALADNKVRPDFAAGRFEQTGTVRLTIEALAHAMRLLPRTKVNGLKMKTFDLSTRNEAAVDLRKLIVLIRCADPEFVRLGKAITADRSMIRRLSVDAACVSALSRLYWHDIRWTSSIDPVESGQLADFIREMKPFAPISNVIPSIEAMAA